MPAASTNVYLYPHPVVLFNSSASEPRFGHKWWWKFWKQLENNKHRITFCMVNTSDIRCTSYWRMGNSFIRSSACSYHITFSHPICMCFNTASSCENGWHFAVDDFKFIIFYEIVLVHIALKVVVPNYQFKVILHWFRLWHPVNGRLLYWCIYAPSSLDELTMWLTASAQNCTWRTGHHQRSNSLTHHEEEGAIYASFCI